MISPLVFLDAWTENPNLGAGLALKGRRRVRSHATPEQLRRQKGPEQSHQGWYKERKHWVHPRSSIIPSMEAESRRENKRARFPRCWALDVALPRNFQGSDARAGKGPEVTESFILHVAEGHQQGERGPRSRSRVVEDSYPQREPPREAAILPQRQHGPK